MPDYDVVVIGAGNGGLTAALTLARGGRRVLLLERHNVPGGCATSFVRGRFEFEVALHQLSGVGRPERPGPLRSLLTDLGVFDKLEFVEIENLYRIVIPGVFDATLPADRPELVKALQGWFPDERDAINRFFEFLYAFSLQYIQGRFFADAEISKEKYPLYFRYALKGTQEVLDQAVRYNLTLKVGWLMLTNGLQHIVCRVDPEPNPRPRPVAGSLYLLAGKKAAAVGGGSERRRFSREAGRGPLRRR